MGTLLDSYKNVITRVNDLSGRIQKAGSEIRRLSADNSALNEARIKNLEAQIGKIDDYLLRIKGFQELAKRNLDSQNLLTIEAPPGYRVNLNRLRSWAMMIDPMSPNDPYAQRVYVVAKCDECFLTRKKQEFEERIAMLRGDDRPEEREEIRRLEKEIEDLRGELRQYAASDEVARFSEQVTGDNLRYWFKTAPDSYPGPEKGPDSLSPGAVMHPLRFGREESARLQGLMGDCYDAERGRVMIPLELGGSTGHVITVTCSPSRQKELDLALRNYILQQLHTAPAGSRRVYVLDAVRLSSAVLGSLRQLEDSSALKAVPRTQGRLSELLEEIAASLADTDEILDLYDSISLYNEDQEDAAKRLPLSTLVLVGWPGSFGGHDREMLLRIMGNYERYGFSLLLCTYGGGGKEEEEAFKALPEYARQNAIRIRMTQGGTTVSVPDGETQDFRWYCFADQLSSGYVQSFRSHERTVEKTGNEYIKRYSLTDIPPYERKYKPIVLPFGIDGKDEDHSLTFENENFATYLVGASRSGKSTLLHTLIAGLIRNYHPDNVELWLADFKQLEFKRYITHCPPHVRYILLDESTELVYDLVDRLTDVMMERQKLFARLGVERIDQVDPAVLEEPLPLIFVILDEFSIMSQSIAESPVYKLRLQNLLAKGAALGLRFLFSSQTFTTGVSGLTSTARAQIQQRIAMKGSREEISETLELSADLKTEQVRNWMEALPPHYALVKFRPGPDERPQVKRYLVMYFKDYGPRDDMIESIRSSMTPVDTYTPSDLRTYVDKRPVLVDGNSYNAFDPKAFRKYMQDLHEKSGADLTGDERFVMFGTPRRMVPMKVSAISSETRENILLLARMSEQAAAASIITSAMRCFRIQKASIQIWAYDKNPLFRAYRDVFARCGAKMITGMDGICDAIRGLKESLQKKEAGNQLIVLIGMDRICMDFEYLEGGDAGANAPAAKGYSAMMEMRRRFAAKGAVAETDEDEADRRFAFAWSKKKDEILRDAAAAGKSEAERKAMLEEAYVELKKAMKPWSAGGAAGAAGKQDAAGAAGAADVAGAAEGAGTAGANSANAAAANAAAGADATAARTAAAKADPSGKKGAYNAAADFVHVIKYGSRLGHHFLCCLNTLADLKLCGLRPDEFRYRMAFRMSREDSRNFFGSRVAETLPEHICQYDDTMDAYSFRPYLHPGIGWEGWSVADDGSVTDPYREKPDKG